MEGFGGAFTESAALVLDQMKASNAPEYARVLDMYFRNDDAPSVGESGLGIGYTMGGVPMGSCDFSPYVPSWSYDDIAGDLNLTHFSIENDVARRFRVRDAQERVAKRVGAGGSALSLRHLGPLVCARMDESQR